MSQYRLTLRSINDLEAIADFVGKQDPAAAMKLLELLFQKFDVLAEFPRIGQSVPAFGENVRIFSAKKYVIYYRVYGEQVQISRVVHGSRDFHSLDQD